MVLPAVSLAFTWAIFSAGLPRELPVAVVDQDHSRLSRQLARMIDATPTIRVSERPADPRAAEELIQRLAEMGAALRHLQFEWLVLWALAALYFALAWLAGRRAEACERGADAGV